MTGWLYLAGFAVADFAAFLYWRQARLRRGWKLDDKHLPEYARIRRVRRSRKGRA